jgi:hypothetical protein
VISYPNAFEQPSWQPSFRCASLSRNPGYVDYGSGGRVVESRRVHASAQGLTKGNRIPLFRVLGHFSTRFLLPVKGDQSPRVQQIVPFDASQIVRVPRVGSSALAESSPRILEAKTTG